ncbi:hypothetical protein ACWGQ5_55360 [Streptomyces sp. NPDC055722]
MRRRSRCASRTAADRSSHLVDDPERRFTPSGARDVPVASTPRTFDRQTNEGKDDESVFLTLSPQGCVRCASPTRQVQAGEKIRHVGTACLEFIIEFIRWARVVWVIAVPTGHRKHSGFFYKVHKVLLEIDEAELGKYIDDVPKFDYKVSDIFGQFTPTLNQQT